MYYVISYLLFRNIRSKEIGTNGLGVYFILHTQDIKAATCKCIFQQIKTIHLRQKIVRADCQ